MIATNSFLPEFNLSSKMPEAIRNPKDEKDPRNLLAQFLMGEVYLRLSNVGEFCERIKQIEAGVLSESKRFGNVFGVVINHDKCAVTNFEADSDKQSNQTLQLSHGEFVEVLMEWDRYVSAFHLPTHLLSYQQLFFRRLLPESCRRKVEGVFEWQGATQGWPGLNVLVKPRRAVQNRHP